jgi:uncharacterized protein YbjT (DUF2867 family)
LIIEGSTRRRSATRPGVRFSAIPEVTVIQDTQRVLVVGATGAQGGSVARRLLYINRHSFSGTPYAVRILTRVPDSPAAQALARAGAEVAGGSLDDIESLKAALEDCDLVFGVTNYWEHGEAEMRQGRNLVDAAASSNVLHVVLSTLPSSLALSDGRIHVPHFETKAAIEQHARSRLEAVTFVHVAFYYENLLHWLRPRREADGTLSLSLPQGDTPLAAVSVDDVGPIVEAILHHPASFAGDTIGIVGDDLPVASYAAAMSRALGKKVTYRHIEREAFALEPFAGAEDLAAMFELNRRFIPSRRADLATSRYLHPGLRSFGHWMALNHADFREPGERAMSTWAA